MKLHKRAVCHSHVHIFFNLWNTGLETRSYPPPQVRHSTFNIDSNLHIFFQCYAHFYASGAASPVCLSGCKVLAPKELCTLYPPSKIMNLFYVSLKQVVKNKQDVYTTNMF